MSTTDAAGRQSYAERFWSSVKDNRASSRASLHKSHDVRLRPAGRLAQRSSDSYDTARETLARWRDSSQTEGVEWTRKKQRTLANALDNAQQRARRADNEHEQTRSQLRTATRVAASEGIGNEGDSTAPKPGRSVDVTPKRVAKAVLRAAIREKDIPDNWATARKLYDRIDHESDGDWAQRNTAGSSAYGMFQFLDSTWDNVGGHRTSDPTKQAIYGLRYIKAKYGGPGGLPNGGSY